MVFSPGLRMVCEIVYQKEKKKNWGIPSYKAEIKTESALLSYF